MKLKKAIKTLERYSTGVVLPIREMENYYAPEKYFNKIQTFGYVLKHFDDEIKPVPFRFDGSGEPYQYIDFVNPTFSVPDVNDDMEDWGYYTFEQIYIKFGDLPLHFGINDIVFKSTESRFDLYG